MKKGLIFLVFLFLLISGYAQMPTINWFANLYKYQNTKENNLFNSDAYFENNAIQINAYGGGTNYITNNLELKDSIQTKVYAKTIFLKNNTKLVISPFSISKYVDNILLSKITNIDVNLIYTVFFNAHFYYYDIKRKSYFCSDGLKEIELKSSTTLPTKNSERFFVNNISNKIYLCLYDTTLLNIYEVLENELVLTKQLKYSAQKELKIYYFLSPNLFYAGLATKENVILNKVQDYTFKPIAKISFKTLFFKNYLLTEDRIGIHQLFQINGSKLNFISSFFINDAVRNFEVDSLTNSIIFGTSNKPIRGFLHINYYPTLFANTNSSSIFAIGENAKGQIFASSYQGHFAKINGNKIDNISTPNNLYISGGVNIKDKTYFSDNTDYLAFDGTNAPPKPVLNKASFASYYSKYNNSFYFGTTKNQGLWVSNADALYNKKPIWKIYDSTKENYIRNIYNITEDSLHRIWCGSRKDGLYILNEQNNETKYIATNNLNGFGPIATMCDKNGGMWLAGANSTLYYFNAKQNNIEINKFEKILHPLLKFNNRIMSLAIFEDWLIIAAFDKILLLNLDKYYKTKEVSIKYLNPQETNFTSFTEQNCMFISSKSKNLWFSTSDKLYEINIKKWLGLNFESVVTKVNIVIDSATNELDTSKIHYLKPTNNSFEITIFQTSKDVMPRYISAHLVKDGDTINLPIPNLENKFAFTNLQQGKYKFILEVYEMNGSIKRYEYKITIKKFLYQQWWFWLGLMLLALSIIGYIFNLKRKQAVQAKQLSQLNVVTLSNQFRPHFILNALNTIGADLHDKPSATAVISRLGESIDLIFNHAQQQRIHHSLTTEWMLVKNVIAIHQLMYIKNLQVTYPPDVFLNQYATTKLPLGILQIIVENALLHGLRNKETGPYHLNIDSTADANNIYFTIADNGIGRKQAEKISNFKKHGTGNKNIADILQILNQQNQQKITIAFIDDWLPNETDKGTKVNITIPLQFKYQ